MRMAILTDAVISALAVLGAYMLLWMFWSAFKGRELPRKGEILTALLRVSGGAPSMQHTVDSLISFRSCGIAEYDIIILDEGLDPVALDIARRLAAKPGVTLFSPQETNDRWMNALTNLKEPSKA
jgi:hypothetical protein